MTKIKRQRLHLAVLLLLLITTACGDLIIKDDGQVTLGLEDCDGVSFEIIVEQSGKPNTDKVVKVKDGELELDVSDAEYDFDRPIRVQIFAAGPGAEACGIDGTREFNGIAEETGIRDHKISLSDFKKR